MFIPRYTYRQNLMVSLYCQPFWYRLWGWEHEALTWNLSFCYLSHGSKYRAGFWQSAGWSWITEGKSSCPNSWAACTGHNQSHHQKMEPTNHNILLKDLNNPSNVGEVTGVQNFGKSLLRNFKGKWNYGQKKETRWAANKWLKLMYWISEYPRKYHGFKL